MIIAGSRDVMGNVARRAIERLAPGGVTLVLDGGARGVDLHGAVWARDNSIPVTRYDADWANLGKAAGPIRNQQMVDNADALLLVWDGRSRGSADIRRRAVAAGLAVYEAVVSREGDPARIIRGGDA